MTRYLIRTLAFGTMICVNHLSLYAAIVLNPSFESPSLGTLNLLAFNPGDTIGTGWSVDPQSPSVALLLKSGALGGPTTTDGNQYILFGGNPNFGIIRQDVTLDASTAYRLTFQLADQPADLLGAAVKIDILLGGSTIIGGPASFNVVQDSGFQNKELFFTTTQAATYRLNVIADGGSTSVDAFSLVAIPEPSTFALVSITFLAFSTTRYRPGRRS